MSKKLKILIVVIVDMLLIIGIDCFYGFVIGGYVGEYADIMPTLRYLLNVVAFCGITGFMSMLFIEGISLTKRDIKLALVITAVMAIFCSCLYNPLNTLSAGEVTREFDSKVVDFYYAGKGDFFDTVIMPDENGKLIYHKQFSQKIDLTNTEYVGVKVHIRERMGGFGYPVYEVEYLN